LTLVRVGTILLGDEIRQLAREIADALQELRFRMMLSTVDGETASMMQSAQRSVASSPT
jgi:hypothetical protein